MLFTQKPLAWTNDIVKVLGVDVAESMTDTVSLNYSPVLDKMESILQSWSHRTLSPAEKFLSLTLSLLLFSCTKCLYYSS